MCRVLSYLGLPVCAEMLLYDTDNSLIHQSYNPRLMSHSMLNLAGFGLAIWDRSSYQSEKPFLYKTPTLPFYDENLKSLASKITANCLLAHVRGVEYTEKNIISTQNAHPFLFQNTDIAFAHNGSLVGFEHMRYDMADKMKEEYKIQINGTTDSEWMYALFLSHLSDIQKPYEINTIFDAIFETFGTLKAIRKKRDIHISSPLNFFISNGSFIVGTRYVLDYGHYPDKNYLSPHMTYHSLWYTYGNRYGFYDNEFQMEFGDKNKSIIISSEPITSDSTTWIEVPEYSFIGAKIEKDEVSVESVDIII
jgi:glutamine amidotransferase